ncbi:MAG: Ig-like domain-containing protein, partial [Gemmatimonadota bacterium]|nr:Ig-like domain-containing protein [Gemmatimonadota bacterium]
MRDSQGAVMSGQSIAWSVSDTAVLQLSGSTVTALKPGSATVIGKAGSAQGSATVTVIPVPVASVAVTPPTVAVTVGRTTQLLATAKDALGSTLIGRTTAWSSASPAVATVDAGTGLVTGISVGTATITGSSEGKSASALVTVGPAVVPVATVTVS